MSPEQRGGLPWALAVSEAVGTALLLACGLSLVIVMFGVGSPLPAIVPGARLRGAITGFLFGTIGGLIALSPVGKISGAHINPVVTLCFWLMGKIEASTLVAYVAAQLVGAGLGMVPLLAWGAMGRSIAFGATVPGPGYSVSQALAGEVITTFAMVLLLCVFLGFRQLRRYTPAIFAPLYSFMVWAESAVSGTSTNPARSFGPALVSGVWDHWWIYWIGPAAGALLATLVASRLAWRIEVAKLYHFDSANDRLARRPSRGGARPVG